MLTSFFSSLVTREQKVVRTDFVRQGNEDYGYCEDQWTYQDLIETVRFLGVPVRRRRVDREEVPAHVLIELGATGYTSWKSKFAAQIAAQGWHYGLMNEIDPRTAPKNPLPNVPSGFGDFGPMPKDAYPAIALSILIALALLGLGFLAGAIQAGAVRF